MSLSIIPFPDTNSATDFLIKQAQIGIAQAQLASENARASADRIAQAQNQQRAQAFDMLQMQRASTVQAHNEWLADRKDARDQQASNLALLNSMPITGADSGSPSDAVLGGGGDPGDLASGVLGANYKVTGYHPYDVTTPQEAAMEGGTTTATGRPVFTLEDYKAGNAPYVTVATDPATIALGTKLASPAFPGVPFLADDTGGDIKGNHVDIATKSRDTASAITGNAPFSLSGNPAPQPSVGIDDAPGGNSPSTPAGQSRPGTPADEVLSAVTTARNALAQIGVPRGVANNILGRVASSAALAGTKSSYFRTSSGAAGGFFDTEDQADAEVAALGKKGLDAESKFDDHVGQWLVTAKSKPADETAAKSQSEQRQELAAALTDRRQQMHDLESDLSSIEKNKENAIFGTTTGIFKGADGVERFGEPKVDAGASQIATPAMKARYTRYLAMQHELQAVQGEHDDLSDRMQNLGKDSASGAGTADPGNPDPAAASPGTSSATGGKVFKSVEDAEAAGAKPGDVVLLVNPKTGKPQRARLQE